MFHPREMALVMAMTAASLLSSPVGNVGATARASGSIDWPQYQFDAAHTGNNRLESVIDRSNVASLSISFSDEVGDFVSFYGQPVLTVGGGLLFVGSATRGLLAFDANGCGADTCQPLWTGSTGDSLSDPVLGEGVVFVESSTASTLYAFDAAGCASSTCSPLWTANVPSVGPPVVAYGRVYAGGSPILQVFSVSGCEHPTCKPLWTSLGTNGVSTPAVSQGMVYAGGGPRILYAWSARGCGAHRCPALWTGRQSGNTYVATAPAVANGSVYVGYGDGLYAFPASGCGSAECYPLWHGHLGGGASSGPAIAANTVFAEGSDRVLYAFDASGCGGRDCDQVWIGDLGPPTGVEPTNPVIANGLVYQPALGRPDGGLRVFDASGCGASVCEPLAKPLAKPREAIVVNGVVYVQLGKTVVALRPSA